MINNSYYPLKKHKDQVLEELSSRIDIVVLVNKPLTSMGDYTPNYFNINERDCLETDLVPCGLQVQNSKHPTRVQSTSKSLIDYIISDHLQANTFKTYVSDSLIRTIKNKVIDHKATSAVKKLQLDSCARVFNEQMFDKKSYTRQGFSQLAQRSDWFEILQSN